MNTANGMLKKEDENNQINMDEIDSLEDEFLMQEKELKIFQF